jgi:hypothetical protein
MSNQKKEPNAIQQSVRHNKNFEIYITQYATKNRLSMSGPIWEAALAAARRLDYTGDRHATPEMRLTPSQASFVNRLFTRLFRQTEPATISEIDDIRAFLEQAPQAAAEQSEIRWGMPRNRFASHMEARLLPGGEQKGSRPTPARFQDTPGWKLLHRRKLKDGKKTLYVRAHLLHERMGGAGVGYNLTPLTGANGDFGANHANFVHYYLVEVVILEAYLNMHRSRGRTPTYREIYYKVEADFNRPPRKGTEELKKIAQAYKKSAEELAARLRGARFMPTHQQVMNELARLEVPHLESAMLAVTAELWEDWEDVYKRIVNNQQLWQFEDENVALALNITYSWVDASRGELDGPYQVTVPIILPTSLAARYE